ncbi:hypothetical protein Ocin01_17256 [Orchesella cincta]|uniref:Uncharacterized protein n=1 Tax=Orchesella cincta TaxID=48709 RepID=A0A1D2M916_ORCCI|nr:hypothetical protein Ocin01_17256 [Orchesella cincta]
MPEEPKAEEPSKPHEQRKSHEARKSDEARKSGDAGKPPAGLAPAQVENVPSRVAFGLAPTPSDIIQATAGRKVLIPILLYEQNMEKKKLPSWMKHYRYVAYVIYFLIACYSWAYLAFIGYFQGHPACKSSTSRWSSFWSFNSYSVLSPLLFVMALLAYHVHKQVNLNEGDFFGLLGLLLPFSMINLPTGLASTASPTSPRRITTRPPKNTWILLSTTKYLETSSTGNTLGQRGLPQILIAPTSTLAERAIEQVATANLGMAKLRCKEWHNAKDKAKTRFWMTDLQQEFKCCGPYGLKQWKEWFANISDTGCDEAWYDPDLMDVPDCFDPLMRWFHGIFEIMMVIMFIQSGLWIIAMIFASIHFAAMKYEQEAPERTFSLLNMTDPEANKHEDLAWARPSNHGNVDEKGGTKGDEAQTMLQIQKDTSDHHRHSKHSKKHLK